MAVKKRGEHWHIDVTIRGKRYRIACLEARTKAQAQHGEAALRQQIYDGRYGGRKEAPALETFIDETYLPWARANKRSWKTDEWHCRVLKEYFAGKRLDDISPILIEKFKRDRHHGESRLGRQRSQATVNRHLEVLSRIFTMAMDNDLVTTNPSRKVRKFRVDSRRERYLSVEEETRLMDAFVGAREYLRPIVILALNTGMRRGEILGLPWVNVDFGRNLLLITKTKSGKPRYVPMNEAVRSALLKLQAEAGGEYVFESWKKQGAPLREIKKAFRAAVAKAEIENFRFHDLRHTAGTRLAEAGADAFTIKDILGHATIQTSAIYVHATDAGKRRAVEALAQYGERDGHNLVTIRKKQVG